MNESSRVLVWMLLFLIVVGAVCYMLFAPLREAFFANQVFNGMIIGVLFVGVLIDLRQVGALSPALRWINAFRRKKGVRVESRPKLLAPMEKLLSGVHKEGFRLSTLTMRSMLDSIRSRLDESRELSRYMIGLLIFLGLLGTFWGLLDTVKSVGGVISGLSAGSDLSASLEELKGNLQAPLSGMGTAFSSSLFGLGGALVLGFLDLQAGHAQNRFYNYLEEWLSELIHLPSGGLTVEAEQSVPRYIEALLEQTADNLNSLQRTVVRSEEDRRISQSNLLDFTERLAELTDQMRSEQKIMVSLTKNQMDLQPAIARLADGWGADEAVRNHLRNLDASLTRLIEEFSSTRKELMDEVRNELRLLTRTLAQNVEYGRRQQG